MVVVSILPLLIIFKNKGSIVTVSLFLIMFRLFLNWRILLFLIAIVIVTGTIFYSQYLANKIAADERQRVETWVEAGKSLINSPEDADTKLVSTILTHNDDIPIIQVNEEGVIIEHINIDTTKAIGDSSYFYDKLKQFRKQHPPIVYTDPLNGQKDYYYYGASKLLREVQYYPLVQLLIVALFIVVTVYAISTSNRSVQNQLWAGMAKETAHQLGTPVTSLQGWVEMLKENPANDKITRELAKDVDRLQLVSDRFSKIGSKPSLEPRELLGQVNGVIEYIKRRASGKVQFLVYSNENFIPVELSAALFDWVIENLLKNALDALEGKGTIKVDIRSSPQQVIIDVTDTGKGISAANLARVFKPGFTTKRRGWGLGLTLSKRIIEQYHQGQLFVKSSEPGKGTTFRIVLKRSAG